MRVLGRGLRCRLQLLLMLLQMLLLLRQRLRLRQGLCLRSGSGYSPNRRLARRTHCLDEKLDVLLSEGCEAVCEVGAVFCRLGRLQHLNIDGEVGRDANKDVHQQVVREIVGQRGKIANGAR